MFTLAMGVESTSFALCTSCIYPVLCEGVPKFIIDRLHDVGPRRGCKRCRLMSVLLCCASVNSWHWVTGRLVRRLQHSYTLECKSSKLCHALIIIGRVGGNICGGVHDCRVSHLGQYVSFIKFCFEVPCKVMSITSRRIMGLRPLGCARQIIRRQVGTPMTQRRLLPCIVPAPAFRYQARPFAC
jgi:hypothetical protein